MSEKALSGTELASLEKEAAKTLELGDKKWFLIAGGVLFLLSLALPHIRGVMGFQVLTLSDTASSARVTLAEYVFYYLGIIGVVIFGLGTVITKRTWMAWVGWIFSCVTLVFAVFAIWMRQTSTSTQVTYVNIGMILAIVAAIAAVWGLSTTILARSDAQEEIAQRRSENHDLDHVASAQRALLEQQQHSPETNPLLIDDRRARVNRRRHSEPEQEG
ncbi:MFS transporter [Corynebacterium callunae]|uniref:Rv2732c family membrane protein n=1 Tax=Corynebacterium callunae TaxID=1721 RepID=UPI003982C9BC